MIKLLLLLLLFQNVPAPEVDPNSPLTDDERAAIIDRLTELKAARERLAFLESYVVREAAQDERQKELDAQALKNKDDALTVANERTALAQERLKDSQEALKIATQKRGAGCWVKKIFTVGLSGCH